MKTLNIILAFVFTIVSFSVHAQNKTVKKDSVKVWGNCEMCQSKIEKAAKAAGATSASWDVDSKVLTVAYNSSKSSIKQIEKAVAAAGYDTKNEVGDDKSYDKLHGCCKYDRKGAAAEENAGKKD